jgi:YVTN family beta-propeller protein
VKHALAFVIFVTALLSAASKKPVYVGAQACLECHRSGARECRVWLKSKHAAAFSALLRPEAPHIAALSGLRQEPAKSPVCLSCHSTASQTEDWEREPGFRIEGGVQCESCHGPGSEYMEASVMRDRVAAAAAGLLIPDRSTCQTTCHVQKSSHDAVLKHNVRVQPLQYKTPTGLALRPGGRELYITCQGSDSVAIVDTARLEKIAEIRVGGQPMDVTFTPEGTRAFVSNRHDDTVSVIDVAARRTIATLDVGDEPHGVLTDRAGKYLYVLNTSSNDITVLDAGRLERLKTLSAGRGPWSMALSPDGATLFATNSQSRFAFRAPLASEITAIETDRGIVDSRLTVPGANLMLGIAWHPSGRFAMATLNRTKTLVPMTRLMQGWTITNGLAVISRDGRVDQVLLDEPDQGFADATDVAFTPDGRQALVTSATTNRIAVVDVAKLTGMLAKATAHEREHVIPNHLGKASEFVTAHLATGRTPRAIVVSHDGRTAFTAESLDDTIGVVDLARMQVIRHIDLGGPQSTTKARYGERLFHSAAIAFRRQFSCSSCHPDGHVDGLTYDIEADGIGVSPVDNRTLRGILDTAPFKWEGTNPSLSRQCGARLSVFFTRLQPFTPEELAAIDLYVTTIQRPPNRHRAVGARFTPAQRRGRDIFYRTATTDGRVIPPLLRCVTCHNPPYFTDRQVHDVGTKRPEDRTGRFDTPHLSNIYDSAPYLHNGMAFSLEEIWTVYNPDDLHGVTNDLTKDQLNDLIEYLKTL